MAIIQWAEFDNAADALGLLRSIVDNCAVVRCIANEDSEPRKQRFIDFEAKKIESLKDPSSKDAPTKQKHGDSTCSSGKSLLVGDGTCGGPDQK
jgi:hypothetical protein